MDDEAKVYHKQLMQAEDKIEKLRAELKDNVGALKYFMNIKVDQDTKLQSLQTKLDVAMGALESAHDHFVDHYNKAPCPHCKFGYEECKDALSTINEELK